MPLTPDEIRQMQDRNAEHVRWAQARIEARVAGWKEYGLSEDEARMIGTVVAADAPVLRLHGLDKAIAGQIIARREKDALGMAEGRLLGYGLTAADVAGLRLARPDAIKLHEALDALELGRISKLTWEADRG